MFRGERFSLFWAGLVVLGLASCVLFASVWSNMRALLDLYLYSSDIAYDVPAIVCSVVFILVGLFMMRSGVAEKPPSANSQMALLLLRGEKTSVFLIGLNVLCVALVIGFSEIWSGNMWFDMGVLLLDHISIFVGVIVFILIGLFMMKSGIKKEAPLPQKPVLDRRENFTGYS